jgi:hypothetical protein
MLCGCFDSAGCHVGGGNIVQAGATLFPADLEKNGVADSSSLYQLIYAGKGRMPGFGQECAPKVRPGYSCQWYKQLLQWAMSHVAGKGGTDSELLAGLALYADGIQQPGRKCSGCCQTSASL